MPAAPHHTSPRARVMRLNAQLPHAAHAPGQRTHLQLEAVGVEVIEDEALAARPQVRDTARECHFGRVLGAVLDAAKLGVVLGELDGDWELVRVRVD